MLNMLANNALDKRANVVSMLEGHHKFVEANTGVTKKADEDHFLVNAEGIFCNNRHFLYYSQQEGQPNGDGTTEGQSLGILGYLYAYLGTKDDKYLDAAKKYFDAYIKYFYDNEPIPTTPKRFVCNWILNSKDPVLSNWPIDPDLPTHSGFKGVEFAFNKGRLAIPHGDPHWGEYLDKATFAFKGFLAWDAINASVKGTKADGTVNWDTDGEQYDVDWLVDYLGRKVDWDGNILQATATEPMGTVQLKNKSVTGTYKFNYATCQPVEHGGTLIATNKVWHNRPLRVPVAHAYMGNSSDSEQWFADAAYILWKITKDAKYKMVYDCTLVNLQQYIDIDAIDKFFRQDTSAKTPFTEGISYDWQRPDTAIPVYGRNAEGYITIDQAVTASSSLEQQAIWYRVNQQSVVRTTVGGVAEDGTGVDVTVELYMSDWKSDAALQTVWQMRYPASKSLTPVQYDTPLNKFVQSIKEDGTHYILSDLQATSDYGGGVTFSLVRETNILGSRDDNCVKVELATADSTLIIGFWLLTDEGKKAPLNSLTYKNNTAMQVKFDDDYGWTWVLPLPATNEAWVTHNFDINTATLASWQQNEDGVSPPPPRPDKPFMTTVDQFTVSTVAAKADAYITYYCVNDVPPMYTKTDGYTIKYRITFSGTGKHTAIMGDCFLPNHNRNNLAYTPGVIPFSNIYQTESMQFDGWHGMPYPGYQYPFIYVTETTADGKEKLNNMINFMYDSQKWYQQQNAALGPGASAYLWNRWDNLKYGVVDTFTMYHWGNDGAWSGYQPRAFFGAARAWHELIHTGQPVPPKLIEYTENWAKWLIQYCRQHKMTPTNFPEAGAPMPVANDFTSHMCGLWLAGACYIALCGSKVYDLEYLIDTCIHEFEDNYIVVEGKPGHIMNGSWSPGLRSGNETNAKNNSMAFGFHTGEVMRGLGLYLLYKNKKPGADLYDINA